jgi:hypothetical protein
VVFVGTSSPFLNNVTSKGLIGHHTTHNSGFPYVQNKAIINDYVSIKKPTMPCLYLSETMQ